MRVRHEFYKILLLGNSGVGKTSLSQRWLEDKIPGKYKKSIGVDSCIKAIDVEDVHISLQLWDVAGQERLERFVINCYQCTDAIFLLYDVTAPSTLSDISNWLNHIKRNMDEKCYQRSVVVLVGNKIDQRSCVSTAQVEVMQEKVKEELKLAYLPEHIEISTKTGKNVQHLFVDVAKKLLITAPSIEESPVFNDLPDHSSPAAISLPLLVGIGCAAIICVVAMFLWSTIIALPATMLALLVVGALILIATTAFAAFRLTQYCQSSPSEIKKDTHKDFSSTFLLKSFGKDEPEKINNRGSKLRKFHSFEMEEKSPISSASSGLIVDESDEDEYKFTI